MSWNESKIMDERLKFISETISGDFSMSELCERYGISRPTGYKWVERYRSAGLAGLADRSHAAHHHGLKTADAIAEAIVAMRRQRPSWGPKKIIGKLRGLDAAIAWPAPSTAGAILKRAGLVNGRQRKRRVPPRTGDLVWPLYANHVWAADHKGWVSMRDGARLEPLTVTDSFSRYLVVLSATRSTKASEAIPVFERAFQDHGLPEVIRTDNGAPFCATGTTGLTRLSALWTRLGIHHERIDPGRPQQNGRHERFHLTLKEAMISPQDSFEAQAVHFERFRADYNQERPHEALAQRPPADLYTKSPRPMPQRPPEPDYPDEATVRKVRSNGEIKWNGGFIYISDILIGDAVGIQQNEDGNWKVSFFNRPLGIIDTKNQRLVPAIAKTQTQANNETL
jgi:putative transposase